MPYKYLLTITGVALILLSSCVKEDFSRCPTEITIAYRLSEFTPKDGFSLRAAPTPPYATDAENDVTNLYLFLFPTTAGQTVKRFFLSSPTATGTGCVGTFENLTKTGTITLSLTPAEAGKRNVYLVTNCADLKDKLDTVTVVNGLKSISRENNAPWTTTTPLLMSGDSLNHDFAASGNDVLDKITLTRAVAKLQVDVTLDTPHQGAISDYGYKYLNFGTKTHVIENEGDQANSAWQTEWSTFDAINTAISNIGYNAGKVESFTLTTYINEYATGQTPVASVQFKFPYNPVSGMPPPEFGDSDIYTIQLPAGVERNMLFYYNVSVQ